MPTSDAAVKRWAEQLFLPRPSPLFTMMERQRRVLPATRRALVTDLRALARTLLDTADLLERL